MKVDPGRLDRAVAGLRLDRFEGHAGFAQPGQTGVSKLMTGQTLDPGATTGTIDDLVEASGRQSMATPGSLQDHKHLIGRRGPRAFLLEVAANAHEEPGRHRDDALVAALALSNEHSAFAYLEVFKPQSQDLATPQTTKDHSLDHRPIPLGPQCGEKPINLRW